MGEIYVSNNVKVKAIRLTPENKERIFEFAKSKVVETTDPLVNDQIILEVDTFEGKTIATEGDWIIEGTHGEFYPCKHDVFIKKYREYAFKKLPQEHIDMIRHLCKSHSGVKAIVVDKYGIQSLGKHEVNDTWELRILEIDGLGINLEDLPQDIPIFITEEF